MKFWFDVVGMSILSRSMHSAGTKIIEFFADGYKLKAETSSFKLLIGRLFFPMAVYAKFCRDVSREHGCRRATSCSLLACSIARVALVSVCGPRDVMSFVMLFRDKCPLLAISRHDLGWDWMLLNCCAGCAVLVCPFTAQSHAKPWPKGWGFCSLGSRAFCHVRYWHKADIGLCAAHVCF